MNKTHSPEAEVSGRRPRGSAGSRAIDHFVAQRLRVRRNMLGLSQQKLGETLGLTFQQVQKYERGTNRISAGTLFELSSALKVPVSFFFEGCSDGTGAGATHARRSALSTSVTQSSDLDVGRREARLLRLWRNAPPAVAEEVLGLLAALTQAHEQAAQSNNTLQDQENLNFREIPTSASLPTASSASTAIAAPTFLSAPSPAPRVGRTGTRRRRGAVWDPADIVPSGAAQDIVVS